MLLSFSLRAFLLFVVTQSLFHTTVLALPIIGLKSSVMWQKGSKFIYPPGVTAVLTKDNEFRSFRIEQYYNRRIDSSFLKVYVRGREGFTSTLGMFEQHLQFEHPHCDFNLRYGKNNEPLGYRCYVDFEVKQSMPLGALGIAFTFSGFDGGKFHPNSVFRFTFPSSTNGAFRQSAQKFVSRTAVSKQKPPKVGFSRFDSVVKDNVVQITKDGNFSVGSGFITKDVSGLDLLFPHQTSGLDTLPCGGVFIVTAAHLFPSGLDVSRGGAPWSDHAWYEMISSLTYDLRVADYPVSRGTAILLMQNDESDVAVLYLNEKGVDYVKDIQGHSSCHDISGLTIDQSPAYGSTKVDVYGFSGFGGNFRSKSAVVRSWATDDTSNFGPIGKLKIEQNGPAQAVPLAENGMSGGPIVNNSGKVVGISVEKPISNNSLIAINFKSLGNVEGSGYFRDHFDDPSCELSFNPFDRILRITSLGPDCNYGNFGSKRRLKSLDGRWVLQEILALPSSGDLSHDSGYILKNGHSIINGVMLINDNEVFHDDKIIVNSENIEFLNLYKFKFGYRMDRLSFTPMVPTGVKLISYPTDEDVPMLKDQIISGIKVGVDHGSMRENPHSIRSLRDFVIWLRSAERTSLIPEQFFYLNEARYN